MRSKNKPPHVKGALNMRFRSVPRFILMLLNTELIPFVHVYV